MKCPAFHLVEMFEDSTDPSYFFYKKKPYTLFIKEKKPYICLHFCQSVCRGFIEEKKKQRKALFSIIIVSWGAMISCKNKVTFFFIQILTLKKFQVFSFIY